MADNNTSKERLKEITDSIEVGIKELFESEKSSAPCPVFTAITSTIPCSSPCRNPTLP